MIVVAIIGILAAVAIPSFMRYIRKARTTEARQMLKKIYDGARAYYLDQNHNGKMSYNLLPRQFPRTPLTGMAPSDPTACCEKCAPDAMLWTDETWVVLQFSLDDPAYFSYSYIGVTETSTTGVASVPLSFTARANGDLDCDGMWSTFEMYGTLNSLYSDGPGGNAGIYRQAELE